MHKETVRRIIADLNAGRPPQFPLDDFPCFSAEATEGNPHITPASASAIAQSLTAADIPVFERALLAIDAAEQAWIGFKIVFDATEATRNEDNTVTHEYGAQGSADGQSGVFFCNEAREIVFSRTPSPRDVFQMKDVTRGPSMHTEQFPGLTWCSVALFAPVRVWLIGASDVAAEVATLAGHVGFSVTVVDDDATYLNADRFPHTRRLLLESFDDLADLSAAPNDYVCVLTRGHMHDPEGCLWAQRANVHYIGMMGCAGKNSRVADLCHQAGMTEAQWERIKRPIGLKFGAKTPAELAIAIVAELVDVRYRERYSEQEIRQHESDLGRN